MQLIPVIDLMGGQVVRAVRGQRSSYQPVRSQVCEGSEPVTVARALCALAASDVLYVADLDALQGGEPHFEALAALVHGLQGVRLWLDAGFVDPDHARSILQRLGAVSSAIDPVFASESLRDTVALAGCFDASDPVGRRGILSLDRRDGRRLDAAGCWERPDLWPERVIVMTLERVGAGLGPDFETLDHVRRLSPQTRLIGAGGVRDAADLQQAAAAGAHAWLVASALHDGRLP